MSILLRYPCQALYRRKCKNVRENTFYYEYAFCSILRETAKSYFIRVHEVVGTRQPKQELWVRKRNIIPSYYTIQGCSVYNYLPITLIQCQGCLFRCSRAALRIPEIRNYVFDFKRLIP